MKNTLSHTLEYPPNSSLAFLTLASEIVQLGLNVLAVSFVVCQG